MPPSLFSTKEPTQAEAEQAMSLAQQAVAELQQAHWEKAASLLEGVVARVHAIPEMHFLLAKCYLQLGRLRSAQKAIVTHLLYAPQSENGEKLLTEIMARRLPTSHMALFSDRNPPKTWPSVSLCMITKNEEANIADCIHSVKDLVSEIIVVDTGSTDRTVDIARSLGARVEFFTWVDDFSAARNESIKYATCDWILVLDADDRVLPADINRIKNAISIAPAEIFLITYIIKHYDSDGRVFTNTSSAARLFKNHLGLTYHNPLHEDLMSREVTERGIRFAGSNIELQHEGYLISQDEMMQKVHRNIRIMEKAFEKDPDNAFLKPVYIINLKDTQRYDEAIALAQDLIRTLPEDSYPTRYMEGVFTILTNHYLAAKDFEALRQHIELTLWEYPKSYSTWIVIAQLFLQIYEDPLAAAKILARARQFTDRTTSSLMLFKPGINTPHTAAVLEAQACLMTGLVDQARQIKTADILRAPRSDFKKDRKRAAQARQMLAEGNPAAVIELLGSGPGADPGALRCLADAYWEKEQLKEAGEFLSLAVALDAPQPGDWTRLAEIELKSNRYENARRLGQMALKGNPSDSIAHSILGIIAMRQSQVELGLEHFVLAVLHDPSSAPARSNLDFAAEKLNTTPIQIIRRQGGTWLARGEQRRAALAFKTVLNENPDDAEVQKWLAELKV
ncbi:MAG TPA: glycosyltransferase [Anaerolineaceae bacterium]|nr:glycosyltransferase [Anaerolineaceae bacterium]HPN53683.1 glycosyltransferase [Anaerolineaceae bacterium]